MGLEHESVINLTEYFSNRHLGQFLTRLPGTPFVIIIVLRQCTQSIAQAPAHTIIHLVAAIISGEIRVSYISGQTKAHNHSFDCWRLTLLARFRLHISPSQPLNHSMYSDSEWTAKSNPWDGVKTDLLALQVIVCELFDVSPDLCGDPVPLHQELAGCSGNHTRVYSFELPSQKLVARLITPVKPLFKTEGEVAAMDFVRSTDTESIPECRR